jgi:hypothetical protein
MDRKHLTKAETSLGGEPAIRAHAYKRMYRMTVMGLSLVRLKTLLGLKRVFLDLAGASLQAGRGSREDQTQAAHNLPRDVLVNGEPFWTYARKLDAHPRIKLQMFYSSAATMTVRRESNYLDSCWEKDGLANDWLLYLRNCIDHSPAEGAGTLGMVTTEALRFKEVCRKRFTATVTSIRERGYFERNKAWLEPSIRIYEEEISGFAPAECLERMWLIYQLEKYR